MWKGVSVVLTATRRVRCAWACFLALLGVIWTLDNVDDCSGATRYDCDELDAAAVLADADGCDVMMLVEVVLAGVVVQVCVRLMDAGKGPLCVLMSSVGLRPRMRQAVEMSKPERRIE